MKKKILITLLVTALLAMAVLQGCGTEKQSNPTESESVSDVAPESNRVENIGYRVRRANCCKGILPCETTCYKAIGDTIKLVENNTYKKR